ncbi:MAG: cache domain-containing protein, partial [Candidatus Omnitrophica bacterium]|nr:cache domain-containing protein [Candidatus Omnitrophota bacterium]
MPLQLRIMLDFVIVIIVLAVSIFALGSHVIRREIMDRTQDEVQNHLKAVRAVYYQELSNIRTGLDLIDFVDDIPALKDKLGLDYLYRVPLAERGRTGNEIVEAAFAGNSSGGTRLIAHQEAAKIGLRPERKQPILIRATPLARPTDKQYLDTLMSIEYARPVYRYGKVESVVYGGRVLNNNAGLIDAMHRVVFKNQYYGNKPTGTVTVFQDDVRVATNVVDEDGERAIGTRVSEAVYHNVIEEGRTWIDRAFVVTDWYVTAYEPIYSIDGRRIGILYVGMLEAPYKDRAAYIGRQYLWIVTAAMVFGMIVALILTVTITRPLNAFVRATDRIAHGELDYRVGTHSRIRELNSVGESVNSMAGRLKERETALNISNGKLRELNRSYLDMISTVTHEIKGMLSSVMLNTHGMKDEIYGPVTETQEKVLRQIIRNLDYFAATVKNFFN